MLQLLQKFLNNKAWSYDAGLLLLRLGAALMLLHGWDKYVSFSENSGDWPDPFHIGTVMSYSLTVFAELGCTVFLLLGLFTRPALVPLIVTFLVIVFVVHGKDPFEEKEHALLYLFLYLSLLFTGPGKYSLDGLLQKRRTGKNA